MKRWVPWISDEALLRFTLGVLFVGLVVLYFADNIFISVPPGHAGVRWSRFFGGTVTTRVYNEGLRIIWPWDKMTLYDVRAQDLPLKIVTQTSEGLRVVIALDLRFHPNIDQLGFLQRNFGSDYAQTIIAPAVGAVTREQAARLTMEEVYATKRSYLEQTVLDDMQRNRTVLIREGVTGIPFVTYDAVFLNEVELPQAVQKAVESKIAQQQATLEWVARVERERLESERRQIEAQGTKAVLALIGRDLSETFVRLRYVEMLERLGASPASKLIVTAPGVPGPGIIIGTEGAGAKGGVAVEAPTPQSQE